MKKIFFIPVVMCAFIMTACAQNDVAMADNSDAINEINAIEKAYSNYEPDIEIFKSKFSNQAKKITIKKLSLNAKNKFNGLRTGCVYKNKLYWSGVIYIKKGQLDLYLFTSNKDFSNVTCVKMNKGKVVGSFVKFVKNNF